MKHYTIDLFETILAEKKQQKEAARLLMLNKTLTVLKEYFAIIPVTQLYLVGSITKEGRFRRDSDIDIAIKGLGTDLYFKVISDLEEKLNRKIEIIELEECSFEKSIKETGLRII